MKIVVIGPNLPRKLADLGTFHVHKAGCADIKRTFGRYGAYDDAFYLEATRALDAVSYVYGPESGGFYEESGFEGTLDEYLTTLLNAFHFAPCVKELK